MHIQSIDPTSRSSQLPETKFHRRFSSFDTFNNVSSAKKNKFIWKCFVIYQLTDRPTHRPSDRLRANTANQPQNNRNFGKTMPEAKHRNIGPIWSQLSNHRRRHAYNDDDDEQTTQDGLRTKYKPKAIRAINPNDSIRIANFEFPKKQWSEAQVDSFTIFERWPFRPGRLAGWPAGYKTNNTNLQQEK